jgi:flavin-dependent dehydrogenase
MFLTKYQIPHVLVERFTLPKEKVCGECYDGRLINVFNQLDNGLMLRLEQQGIIQKNKIYSYSNNNFKKFNVEALPHHTARITTIREHFDKFLLDEALKSPYVRYFDNTCITEISVQPNGVILQTTAKDFQVQAQVVMLATGSQSLLSKNMVPTPADSNSFLLAARGYYRNVQQLEQAFQVIFFLKPIPFGFYMAQLPNNLSTIEVFVAKNFVTKHHIPPQELLLEALKNPMIQPMFEKATLVGKIKGAALPKSKVRPTLSAERVLLIGASGASVNPLTGWGVGHAVYEAMCAVEHYRVCAQRNDFSAQSLCAYDEKIHKKLGKERFLGRIADWMIVHMPKTIHYSLGALAALDKTQLGAILKNMMQKI